MQSSSKLSDTTNNATCYNGIRSTLGEGIVLAKKWQDVEFVDYKERQKRRRMRKRLDVEEEISNSFRERWNVVLVSLFVVLFLGVIGTSGYYLLTAAENLEQKEANMFLEARLASGKVLYRDYLGAEYVPVMINQKFYNRGQFRTGDGSSLEMSTVDNLVIKVKENSEMLLKSIEVFDTNQQTKSTLTLDSGEFVFDSRTSGGLLEIQINDVSIFALRSLFKVQLEDEQISVKVSFGRVSVEKLADKEVISASQMITVDSSELGKIRNFNPLAETW